MSLTHQGKTIAHKSQQKKLILLYFTVKALSSHPFQMPRSNVAPLKSNQEQTLDKIYFLSLQIDTSLIMLIVTHTMDLSPLMSIQLVQDPFIVMTDNSKQHVENYQESNLRYA